MPTLALEKRIQKKSGIIAIAGLDEAGRGALAGPVVAAAVILPLNSPQIISKLAEVDDSKKLSPKIRTRLFDLIIRCALQFGIGHSSAAVVDNFGIIQATKQAMEAALSLLDPPAEYLMIDGRIRLKTSSLPQESIIRGDSKSLTIAAASILAKVTRDRMMVDLDSQYPGYGFARHKGYGTAMHLDALNRLGPIKEHRFSFSPIRKPML